MMLPKDQALTIYEPGGCPRCDNTGYYGRIGVYEILEVSPEVRRVIAKGATAEEIKKVGLEQGMHTLRMSAAEYVVDGMTSFKEMMRVSFES